MQWKDFHRLPLTVLLWAVAVCGGNVCRNCHNSLLAASKQLNNMEKVIYSNSQGMGVILEVNETEQDCFDFVEFDVVADVLKPNTLTTLCGYFDEPVRFVGALKDNANVMCFYLGTDSDLFELKRYYSCIMYLHPTRIVNKYAYNTARDLNWVNGVWK